MLQFTSKDLLTIRKEISDIELIDMICGDKKDRETALRFVYAENRLKAMSFVLKNSGNEEEAKDVFQESMIAFYENVKAGKFEGQSSINTYLYSIIKFNWMNRIKKKGVNRKHLEVIRDEKLKDFELSPKLYDKERRQRIMDLFGQLGEKCRYILVESIYHNSSMKEIAKSGKFSNDQIVRNQKTKCLKKLREIVSGNSSLINLIRGYE